MALSLIQNDNWTNSTESHLGLKIEDTKTQPDDSTKHKSQSNHDLICCRHKGTKLSLLVHIIDGFVIEESNVPFKGSEEEEKIEETTKSSAQPEKDEHNIVQAAVGDEEDEIANASMNSYPQDKDELMSLLPTACKFCGEELPEDRAMWGKRFCSASCAKKHSVQCSQRVRLALQRRTTQSNNKPDINEVENEAVVGADKTSHTPAKRRRMKKKSFGSEATENNNSELSPELSKRNKLISPVNNIDLRFTFPVRTSVGYGLNITDVEGELFNHVEPILKFSVIPMIKWTTIEVYDYINKILGSPEYAKPFSDEQIDGQALLLLKFDHLINSLNLKLGPALKVASHLRLVKMQYGIETKTKYLSPFSLPLLPSESKLLLPKF